MPKIIINEIDKTKVAASDYENFTVAIAGLALNNAKNGFYTSADNANSIEGLDDNNVIELSSQAQFEKLIGIVDESLAKLDNIGQYSESDAVHINLAAVAPTASARKDFDELDNISAYKDRFIELEKEEQDTLFYAEDKEQADESIGYLEDGEHFYKKLTLDVLNNWSVVGLPKIYEINKGEYGADACIKTRQGNKMAYYLLGLGYKVLYKVIDFADIEKDQVAETYYDTVIPEEDPDFWSCFKDKATYDFRYISTGGIYTDAAVVNILDVAKYIKNEDNIGEIKLSFAGRGDCIALVDIPEEIIKESERSNQSLLIEKLVRLTNDYYDLTAFEPATDASGAANAVYVGKYSMLIGPNVLYDIPTKKRVCGTNKFPGTFHYLLCAANTFENYRECYAVAGLGRGASPWKVIGTTLKLGEIAINVLSPRNYTAPEAGMPETKVKCAVNLIIKIYNSYYIWGNRTAHTLGEDLEASHFLNIRQTCCTIKKVIYRACKELTFSPNGDLLWNSFVDKVTPALEALKASQGLRAYRLQKELDPRKAVMKAKVRIVPIEAVEDFEIGIYLENAIENNSVELDEE